MQATRHGHRGGDDTDATLPSGHPFEDAVDRLRGLGQRVTPQRVAILDAFAPGEHLTADEVHARVGAVTPAVNASTIYRTLELFRDLGLLSETDLGFGARHFELLGDSRHHHLVCLDCQAVVDLDDAVVAPLRGEIAERHGFEPRLDHLALFGRCAACRGGPGADAGPGPASAA